MAIHKTEGIVLRVIPFRDTSKILTTYTAEHGVVSLLAKGVRGPKPRFGAALEMLATSDLVYYHRDSRELQLLSQAALLDPHLGLSRSGSRYAYGVGVLEFLLKALAGQEAPGRLYPLSSRVLEVLEHCDPRALPAVFQAFEIKALSFLGHRPELQQCVECGGGLDGPGLGWAALQGGATCAACRGSGPGIVDLPGPVLAWLRDLLVAKLDKVGETAPDPAILLGASRVLEPFLQAHIGNYERLRALRLAAALAE